MLKHAKIILIVYKKCMLLVYKIKGELEWKCEKIGKKQLL